MTAFRIGGMGLALVLLAGCGHRLPTEEDVLNAQAKLPAGLPVAPLEWRAIASGVNRAAGATGTMTLLTGNDLAVKYSAAGSYPEGSQLALVTWLQRDDPHWFGARIPGSFVGLELVTVSRGMDGKPVASYKRYAGDPAREVTDAAVVEARKARILGMRFAGMP